MRPERLWLLGGVVSAIVVLTFGYYFFVRPQYQEADEFNTLTQDTTIEVAKLRSQIAALDAENQQIEQYRTQLQANLAALPETDSVAALLRELQTAGELTEVTVSGVSVGTASELTSTGPMRVRSLPISLTAAGPTAKLNPFLDQLQKVQPRALLISTVNVTATTGGRATLTLGLQAFYATGK